MNILNRIREIRVSKKITQKAMADFLNLSQTGYQKIETGKNELSINRFIEISRILEIDSYNKLLPAVNADTVDKIERVLTTNYLALETVRTNSAYLRKLIDKLIEDIDKGEIDKTEIMDELMYFDRFAEILYLEGSREMYQLNSIRNIIKGID